jgi:hypothetical protein
MITRLLRLEPAVVRGLLIAITAIIAAFVGREVDTAWVDTVLGVYMLLTPIIASLLIRKKVTSTARLTELGIKLPSLGQRHREAA